MRQLTSEYQDKKVKGPRSPVLVRFSGRFPVSVRGHSSCARPRPAAVVVPCGAPAPGRPRRLPCPGSAGGPVRRGSLSPARAPWSVRVGGRPGRCCCVVSALLRFGGWGRGPGVFRPCGADQAALGPKPLDPKGNSLAAGQRGRDKPSPCRDSLIRVAPSSGFRGIKASLRTGIYSTVHLTPLPLH